MTRPNNDQNAFTINSRVHHSQPRIQTTSFSNPMMSASSRRGSTRSPSPKVLFVGARSPVDGAAKRIRRLSLQNGDSNVNGISEVAEHDRINGHAVSTIPEDEHSEKSKEKKTDWEIPRKVLHSFIGFLVIPLYTHHVSPSKVVVNLSAALVVILSVDFVRLRSPRFARIYEKTLGFLMRDSEKEKINGVVWYLCGCIFALSCYPLDISIVSILILSWCDTAASFFGRLWGRKTPALPQAISLHIPFTSQALNLPLPFARRKSLAGSLAATLVGSAIAIGFWGWLAPFGNAPLSLPTSVIEEAALSPVKALSVVGAVTGVVAGVAEALDIGSLDDNLMLPVISGGFLWFFFKFLGHLL